MFVCTFFNSFEFPLNVLDNFLIELKFFSMFLVFWWFNLIHFHN